jgi:hypothetical protein
LTAGLHISAGAFDKARDCLAEVRKHRIASGNFKERNQITYHDARLALEDGDLAGAAAAFERIDPLSPSYSVTRRGYYLALEIQIRLKQGVSTDALESLVTELEVTHLQMRGLGSQDFESYSLYLGLCALGEKERGRQLLKEHVEGRRTKWPLSRKLLRALGAEESVLEVEPWRANTPVLSGTGASENVSDVRF